MPMAKVAKFGSNKKIGLTKGHEGILQNLFIALSNKFIQSHRHRGCF